MTEFREQDLTGARFERVSLRGASFAQVVLSDAWVDRMILGNASPWHPFDLPWDEAPGWDGIPWNRELLRQGVSPHRPQRGNGSTGSTPNVI